MGYRGRMNLYGYVNDMPTSRVDPAGLFSLMGTRSGSNRELGGEFFI